LFGGTWQSINEKFLLAGSSANFPYGSIGGEVTHTLTVAEMPSHGHAIYSGWGDADSTQTTDAYRF